MVQLVHTVDGTSSPDLDAVIFDMDGVVTATATVHAAAWKRLFDEFLAGEASVSGGPFVPFDAEADYERHVDGRNRYDGVRTFLASRGITIPEGDPSDPTDRRTVCGLGKRKDMYFHEQLRARGACAYPGTIGLIRSLRADGVKTGLVTASRNAREIVASAGVADLFDVMVDGIDASRCHLPGKPDPAMFLEAARRLEVEPGRAAVVEDALAGVEAGAHGRFAVVVGVARHGQDDALRQAGADIVVPDLSQLRCSHLNRR